MKSLLMNHLRKEEMYYLLREDKMNKINRNELEIFVLDRMIICFIRDFSLIDDLIK